MVLRNGTKDPRVVELRGFLITLGEHGLEASGDRFDLFVEASVRRIQQKYRVDTVDGSVNYPFFKFLQMQAERIERSPLTKIVPQAAVFSIEPTPPWNPKNSTKSKLR
jgi:hypothetical protein